jgi:hypothetical protein
LRRLPRQSSSAICPRLITYKVSLGHGCVSNPSRTELNGCSNWQQGRRATHVAQARQLATTRATWLPRLSQPFRARRALLPTRRRPQPVRGRGRGLAQFVPRGAVVSRETCARPLTGTLRAREGYLTLPRGAGPNRQPRPASSSTTTVLRRDEASSSTSASPRQRGSSPMSPAAPTNVVVERRRGR